MLLLPTGTIEEQGVSETVNRIQKHTSIALPYNKIQSTMEKSKHISKKKRTSPPL